MNQAQTTLEAAIRLGEYLREQVAPAGQDQPGTRLLPELQETLASAYARNPWFTPTQVGRALEQWSILLTGERLEKWLQPYPRRSGASETVALILAGNVPLVGFHDFLCVLLSGHNALVKCASKDNVLLPFLADKLLEFCPELHGRIRFTEGTLQDFDRVIATGSDNTSRYFEHYFGDRPHIIRKNRNSVAVLTGDETMEDLKRLAEDVFWYFGMGCRSVSKLYVPEKYDFDPLFEAFYQHRECIEHHKYANNYDYNKAVYLMSGAQMLDNGFLLLKEDEGLGSPIGTLFYEPHSGIPAVNKTLGRLSEQLQCIVGPEAVKGSIPFGTAQRPALDQYADGVDTLEFLLQNPLK